MDDNTVKAVIFLLGTGQFEKWYKEYQDHIDNSATISTQDEMFQKLKKLLERAQTCVV